MNTTQKGNLAQAKAVTRLSELGYSVYLPFGEGDKVDLIYLRDNQPIRVQVKHARFYRGLITFNTCSLVKGKNLRVPYTGHIDVFHVYSAETGEVYEIPEQDTTQGTMTLRISPPKNGQKKLVKFAKDYVLT